MWRNTTSAIVVLAALGGSSCASLPDPDPETYYGTRLFLGNCYAMHSSNREALGAVLASNLIAAGLDAVGNALKEAAAESKKSVSASVNLEIPFGNDALPQCMQLVRGTFMLRPSEGTAWAPEEFEAPDDSRVVLANGTKPEFFLEAQLMSVKGQHNGVSFAPTLLMFTKPLSNPTLSWIGGRKLTVDLKLQQAGTATGLTTGMDFGFVRTDAKMFLVKKGGTSTATAPMPISPLPGGVSSAGSAAPIPPIPGAPPPAGSGENGGGGTYKPYAFETPWIVVATTATRTPWILTATLNEVKPAEPALAFVSGIFEKTKPALQTELELALIEEKRLAAEAAALAARNTKLDTFDTKMVAAIAALAKCSKEPKLENAQAALAAQRRANEAGVVIGRRPYPTTIEIMTSESDRQKACQEALTMTPG